MTEFSCSFYKEDKRGLNPLNILYDEFKGAIMLLKIKILMNSVPSLFELNIDLNFCFTIRKAIYKQINFLFVWETFTFKELLYVSPKKGATVRKLTIIQLLWLLFIDTSEQIKENTLGLEIFFSIKLCS